MHMAEVNPLLVLYSFYASENVDEIWQNTSIFQKWHPPSKIGLHVTWHISALNK